ncbi:MAG: hypothetical protein JWP31_1452 [Aeromicrobium sp.]|nr:hypothetical protein [Aeromicrobium sp.]
MSTVEERLQRLEDRDAIHQLFIDYGRYLDEGDFEAYSNLFADESEVKLGPMGRAKGREAIRELMSNTLTDLVGTSYHIISSPSVQIDGDTATSEVMWTVIRSSEKGGTPVLGAVGKHKDQLVRERGEWRFKERRGFVDLVGQL